MDGILQAGWTAWLPFSGLFHFPVIGHKSTGFKRLPGLPARRQYLVDESHLIAGLDTPCALSTLKKSLCPFTPEATRSLR